MKRLLLILILLIFSSCGQESNKLIGTWELEKKEPKLDKSLMIIPISENKDTLKPNKPEIILQFYDNGVLDFKQGPSQFKAKYKLIDTVLTLGQSKYFIQKLNDSVLVMKEDEMFLPKTFFYRKSKLELKSTKEYEEFVETYSNGKIKIKGTYHNGFEDGKWLEYYENGKVKTERYFKDGIAVGEWKHYDETGKLINTTN